MNGIILLIPLLIVRMVYPFITNKNTFINLQHFAPLGRKYKLFYYVYQISQIFLLISIAFYWISIDSYLKVFGIIMIFIGSIIIFFSVNAFNRSKKDFVTDGIYKYTRNPMYIGYFFYYLGIAIIIESIIYLELLILFQISTHFIILSEEDWCINNFNGGYMKYMKKTRRYI